MWIRSLPGWFWLSVICLSAVTAFVLGYSTESAPMSDFPLSSIDRKIDALGVENHIRSEEDAGAYVDALLEKFRIDDKLVPGLTELKSKLVRAEFSAVIHPENRIPEAIVGQIFNQLMDEWQMPAWTRVSPEEVHPFRVTVSLMLYPSSVSRLPNGNVAPNCRPVEALYLLYLLHAKMGIPPELRDAIRAGRWPTKDPLALPPAGGYVLRPSEKSAVEVQRLREYRAALTAYLAGHPNVTFQDEVAWLFSRLRVP